MNESNWGWAIFVLNVCLIMNDPSHFLVSIEHSRFNLTIHNAIGCNLIARPTISSNINLKLGSNLINDIAPSRYTSIIQIIFINIFASLCKQKPPVHPDIYFHVTLCKQFYSTVSDLWDFLFNQIFINNFDV